MKPKLFALTTVGIILVIWFVHSFLASDKNSAIHEQEISIIFSSEPPALDPSIATTSTAFTLLNAIHEGLYRLDHKGRATPGLAAKMPHISEDGLQYTIQLRPGLRWSDGTPLTAEDFAYSFRRTIQPATKAQYSFMMAWLRGGRQVLESSPDHIGAALQHFGIQAVDAETIKLTLERPIPFFTEMLAFPLFFPQKQSFVQVSGERYGGEPSTVLGAGPFKLHIWDHEQRIVLVKNEAYWDAKRVKLQQITLHMVKDPSTALNLFEAGLVDYTEISSEHAELYAGHPEYTTKPELISGYLLFGQKNAPLPPQPKHPQSPVPEHRSPSLNRHLIQARWHAIERPCSPWDEGQQRTRFSPNHW